MVLTSDVEETSWLQTAWGFISLMDIRSLAILLTSTGFCYLFYNLEHEMVKDIFKDTIKDELNNHNDVYGRSLSYETP